jgi:hypothetical protein
MKPTKAFLKLFLVFLFSNTILQHKTFAQKSMQGMHTSKSLLDTEAIERIMGINGKSNHGEYKVTIPQNDLSVEVDGFKIIPAMGLSTWVAFTLTSNGCDDHG